MPAKLTEFQNALARFLQGQLDLSGLEAALQICVQKDPGSAEQILQTLDQLFRSSRLPAQTYITLKQHLSAPQSPAPAPQQPTPPVPQPDIPGSAQPEEDEKLLTLRGVAPPESAHTIVETPRGITEPPSKPPPEPQEQSSDILDILQSGSKEPPATPPPPVAPPATDEPQPSEDKTVFRQSAPPTAPPSQSSVPHTGTGSAARTGPTGATGGASVPTGTGSNWTDPSKWGEGAAAVMQPGSTLKERYVLETVIGRGGMGVVFKAKDLRREEAQDRNPYIAVKILNDEFRRHPESLKALQRESRKAQDLAHPNIVTVFDFDRDGATVYMTMEYLEGQSLDRYTKDAAFDGMPLSEAYPLIEGLGRALSYAHAKNIVHSDLKPANAFLTKGGVIKVFDFGIARAAKLPGDKSGDMTLFDPGSLGALTPAYASCEMLDGEEPDARDDIYALACIAYEMLTGRHPFDKRPASEARDKGLTLAPIKGLSRRNWRGLQRGLAFSRKDRSPNIEVFLEDLKVRKLGKVQIGVGAAAAVGAVAFILLFGPSYLQERRIDNMIAAIGDSNNVEMPAVLQRLYELEAIEQDIVTGNSRVEDRLIDYFIDEIEAAADVDDYPRAEALIGQALAQYDDSNRLAVARDELETVKAALLSDLNNRYNAALEAGRLLPSDVDGVGEVMERLQKIDPNHPALTDPQLAIAYADAAEQLLVSDVLQAGLYIDEGQRRFQGDPRLVGLRDRLNTLRDVQDREVAVAELVQQLSGALASITEIQGFRQFEREILQLEALDPGNRVVGAYRGRLQHLLDTTVDAAISRNDWAQARNAVSDATTLLSQDYRASILSRINAAESNYTDRVGGVYASVVDAAQRGDFTQAENGFVQLEQLSANAASLGQARDAISRGYRDKARSERAAGRFDGARELIRTGQSKDASYTGWDPELELIAQAERMQAEGVADQERQAMEQQRVARINTLQDRIQQNLNQTRFDLTLARDTVGSIDDLAGLDPGAALAIEGRGEVAAKLATEARGRGVRDQKFDDALQLVEQSLAILPNEQALIEVQRELQAERQGYLARIAADQENNLKAELEGLLASPAYDSSWEAGLRRVVQSLEPLAGSAQYLSGKREDIATLYVERARSLRADERFDLAETMLNSSEWFVRDFGPASAESQVLADARQAFNAANQERQLLAQIDGLKRTFTTDLNAGRFPDAKAALTRLGNLLPSGDPFVVNEAPQAIADAYLGVADRALNAGDFDRAERFAREGLREVANHGALTRLLANIIPMRLESNFAAMKKTIQSAPPTDSARPKNTLAMIRADAGAEYPEKEAELISLANQRVSSAGKQRDSVVAWLSNIFPGYVAPNLSGPPCTTGLAGYGSRGRGQCYDFLPGSSTEGPRLVVVPAGSGVARAFAIGRQEVSVGQWNAYCQLSGNCDPRTGTSEQFPITRITVDDAKNFASWLSNGTKHIYRLPTDAEWEHAAKAVGSASISPNCINPQAGLLGDELFEVNRGGQNAWGVMNYVGNAQEWVVGPSGGYQARGGAYKDRLGACTIELSRSHAGTADRLTGFRLVRELGEGA